MSSISETINEKTCFSVIMAIDGTYKNGKYMESESSIVIPNDYVIGVAQKDSRIIFGSSVHPYRESKEMLAETKRCIDEGASFFNWIPSLQQIDPEDERCIPFYLCLAREHIPLLCHRGPEYSDQPQGSAINRYNSPGKLRKALDIGVRVIAAHCMPFHYRRVMSDDKRYFNELLEMLMLSETRKWEFYADISAFCALTRTSYLERIKREINDSMIKTQRFVNACDILMTMIDMKIPEKDIMLNDVFLRDFRDQKERYECNNAMLNKTGINSAEFTDIRDILKLKKHKTTI